MKKFNLTIQFHKSPRVSKSGKHSKATVRMVPFPNSLSIDEFDLIWGSIYANREQKCISNPQARLEHDVALIHYLFNLNYSSNLEINPDILLLEQTQKNYMMNRVGAILCNIVARKCFGIKHLIHLQKLKGMNISFSGNKFPDYIARHNDDYYVFEAKGTSFKSCSNQEKSAIDQLDSIATINGVTPFKYLVQSTIHNKQLFTDVVDPSNGSRNIEVDDECFNDFQFDVENGVKVEIKIIESFAIGHFVNNYYIGYVQDNKMSCNIIDENSVIEDVVLENRMYNGRIFMDGTIILKEQD